MTQNDGYQGQPRKKYIKHKSRISFVQNLSEHLIKNKSGYIRPGLKEGFRSGGG